MWGCWRLCCAGLQLHLALQDKTSALALPCSSCASSLPSVPALPRDRQLLSRSTCWPCVLPLSCTGMHGRGVGDIPVGLTFVPLPSPAERKLGDMATAVGGVQNEILELEGQEAVLLQQLSHLRERLDTVRAKKVGSCDACEGLERPAAPQMSRLRVVMLVM